MPVQQMTQIGTKRQLTLPKAILDRYGLAEGSQLMIEMKEDHLELHPVVSMKRIELPAELRTRFLSRRGAKSTDIPLATLLEAMDYRPKGQEADSERGRHQDAENARMAKLYREHVLGEKLAETRPTRASDAAKPKIARTSAAAVKA
jgi:AbrB family looped-hinge helix DNA binding protein